MIFIKMGKLYYQQKPAILFKLKKHETCTIGCASYYKKVAIILEP